MIRMLFKQHQLRRGTTAVEYVLMLSLIVLACLGSLQMLGQNTRQTFFEVASAIMAAGPAEVGALVIRDDPVN